ncbi:MAG: 4Fe-4S ferredoxin [Chloroflexaceae bacterium]|nr:4Fe-4S ferredoxin [Chloroflexaceae bacterium]NJO05512.1 4Fe-4S ferredoxin [Chloroflexaceae bacterium]
MHPTVQKVRTHGLIQITERRTLDAQWLRQLCLDLGVDDVGFVSIDRPELDEQRADLLHAFPHTRTLISFVCRMNREPVRAVTRSVANYEFHHVGDHMTEVSHTLVRRLEDMGIRAVNEPTGFPMELGNFPNEKPWIISHKPIAVAAGLGQMGIHRNVIHPKFGNFILLGTVLMDADVTEQQQPIEYNPCLECKLCVAACPVGAIAADGHFNFSACYTHNYREFLTGFNDWVETVVDSKSVSEYRERVELNEGVSVWQSLSFGPNYKAAYCMAVCPAGEDVISPFLDNRKQFLQEIVKPLQAKEESIFVVAGSDAEEHVQKRFSHKRLRYIHNGLRPTTVKGFLRNMQHFFQRGQAKGLDAVYHFTFTGAEQAEATVIIRNQTLTVQDGHQGTANLHITADSRTWMRFLAKEANLIWALLRGKIRLKGSPKLMLAFGKCFPS